MLTVKELNEFGDHAASGCETSNLILTPDFMTA